LPIQFYNSKCCFYSLIKQLKMNSLNHLKLSTVFVALFSLVIGCNQPAAEKAPEVTADATPPMAAKADPAKMKADIQALETA
jgi:hypothetical protein